MDSLKLPERQVPIFARTQVIIVGGGVAGLAAAVAAVRQGCKAILIDEGGILGGTVTKCLMPNFGSSSYPFIKGIFAEIFDQLRQRGAIIQSEGRSSPIDPEAFRSILFEVVEKEGIELLLHTCVFDIIRQNKRLGGVFITNKSGIQAITGEVVIDASGDGNVAAMAGSGYSQCD
jgi:flavin-dependent dehydrogenase